MDIMPLVMCCSGCEIDTISTAQLPEGRMLIMGLIHRREAHLEETLRVKTA